MSSAYEDATYVACLHHIGRPYWLRHSGGWCLLRPIGGDVVDPLGLDLVDAVGLYPTLLLRDPGALRDDLEELAAQGVVSFVAMLPKYAWARTYPVLKVIAEVPEYVASPTAAWSKNAERNARAAEAHVAVELVDEPLAYSDDWLRLYAHLRDRHSVAGGFEDFPDDSLIGFLDVPGAHVFVAKNPAGSVVGMLIWYRYLYEDLEWATYHLGAYSPGGYQVGASFALFKAAFRHFAEAGVATLDLGRTPQGADGLIRFKLSLGATIEPIVCGGAVLRPAEYLRAVKVYGRHDWFPAYRDSSWETETMVHSDA